MPPVRTPEGLTISLLEESINPTGRDSPRHAGLQIVRSSPVTDKRSATLLTQAKKAMTAAEAEAKKNNWPVAIAILDTTGSLVMLQKLDNTQTGSVEIAINKARTALDFRRPSKALQDVVAGGGAGLRLLSARNILTLEGGVPVIVDGKVVGAVGVSGVTSEQDAQVAMAGAAAAK